MMRIQEECIRVKSGMCCFGKFNEKVYKGIIRLI